MTNHP